MWEVNKLEAVEYKSLAYLEGMEVEATRLPYQEWSPEKVTVVKDYPNGILLELEFVVTHGWMPREPRHYQIYISKSSIACGNITIKANGRRLGMEDVCDLENIKCLA